MLQTFCRVDSFVWNVVSTSANMRMLTRFQLRVPTTCTSVACGNLISAGHYSASQLELNAMLLSVANEY